MQKKVRQEVSHLGQKCSILSTNESIKKPLKSIKKKRNFSIVNFVFKKFIIDFYRIINLAQNVVLLISEVFSYEIFFILFFITSCTLYNNQQRYSHFLYKLSTFSLPSLRSIERINCN